MPGLVASRQQPCRSSAAAATAASPRRRHRTVRRHVSRVAHRSVLRLRRDFHVFVRRLREMRRSALARQVLYGTTCTNNL